MNESDDPLEEPSDESLQNDPLLEEAFTHLRRLEPSLEARLGYRLAVAEELERLQAAWRKRALPWWRRTIAVPAPLAACLAVAAAILLFSSIRGRQIPSAVQIAAPNQPAQHETHEQGASALAVNHAADAHGVVEYYETETYLCGIGRLNSESGYLIREDDQ